MALTSGSGSSQDRRHAAGRNHFGWSTERPSARMMAPATGVCAPRPAGLPSALMSKSLTSDPTHSIQGVAGGLRGHSRVTHLLQAGRVGGGVLFFPDSLKVPLGSALSLASPNWQNTYGHWDQEPGPEGTWLFLGLARPWPGPRHDAGSCGLSISPPGLPRRAPLSLWAASARMGSRPPGNSSRIQVAGSRAL